MQIFFKDKEISLSEFSVKFPKEAEFLQGQTWDNLKLIISETGQFSYQKRGSDSLIEIPVLKILDYHKKYFYKHSIYREPLAKAIGLKPKILDFNIADATCGLMGDSLLLKAFGLKNLYTFERSPLAAALISNAITINHLDLSFTFGEVPASLSKFFDVIYFDPMYHETNKKAAPKKEMLFLREFLGPDLDAKEKAQTLLEYSKKRLVIKRSLKATPLISGVHHTVRGKSTAYDVYIPK